MLMNNTEAQGNTVISTHILSPVEEFIISRFKKVPGLVQSQGIILN